MKGLRPSGLGAKNIIKQSKYRQTKKIAKTPQQQSKNEPKQSKHKVKQSIGGRALRARSPVGCFKLIFDCFGLFFDCFEHFLIVFEVFWQFSWFTCILIVLLCFWPPALRAAGPSRTECLQVTSTRMVMLVVAPCDDSGDALPLAPPTICHAAVAAAWSRAPPADG